MRVHLAGTVVVSVADEHIVELNYGKVGGGLNDRRRNEGQHVPSACLSRTHVPPVGND